MSFSEAPFELLAWNVSENVSSFPPEYGRAPTFQPASLTKVVILLLIALVSVGGNLATLVSIARGRRKGTVYVLLRQLAVADLLVAAFCILTDALWTLSVQWYGGNVLCKFVKFMQLFALYLSTFLLVLIGVDRLSAVRFPMRRVRAKHHIRLGIAGAWALGALFSLPQMFVFSVKRGPFVEDFQQCVTYGFYTAQWQEQLYTTLSLVLMFVLPFLVLLATYITTFLTIARREDMFSQRHFEGARQRILHRAKVKSFTITVVIVLTFAICWTPYYVTMIIFMFLDPSEQLSHDLQKAIFFFGSTTAAINPLIYGAFHLKPKQQPQGTILSIVSSTRLRNGCTSSRAEKRSNEKLSVRAANEWCLNSSRQSYYGGVDNTKNLYRISPLSSAM